MTGLTVRQLLNRVYDAMRQALKVIISGRSARSVELYSGTVTVSGEGSEIDVENFMIGEVCLKVDAASGTFDVDEGLKVVVEGKDEITGEWRTLYDSESSLGGRITSAPVVDWGSIGEIPFKYVRARWDIVCAAGDASFTFMVSMTGKS